MCNTFEPCAVSPTPDAAALIAAAAEQRALGYSWDDIAKRLNRPLIELRRLINAHRPLYRASRFERLRHHLDHFADESARLQRELDEADTPMKVVRAAHRLDRCAFRFLNEEIRRRWRLQRSRARRLEKCIRSRLERAGLGSSRVIGRRPKEEPRLDLVIRAEWAEYARTAAAKTALVRPRKPGLLFEPPAACRSFDRRRSIGRYCSTWKLSRTNWWHRRLASAGRPRKESP